MKVLGIGFIAGLVEVWVAVHVYGAYGYLAAWVAHSLTSLAFLVVVRMVVAYAKKESEV